MTRSCRFSPIVVLLLSSSFLFGQDFRIIDVRLPQAGTVQINFQSEPSCYYILYRGESVTNITTAVAAVPGAPAAASFSQANTGPTAFYRVEKVRLDQVRDTDGDGLNDLYEMARPGWLNAVDPADAALDYDGDGLSNLFEFEHATDPEQPSLYINKPTVVDCFGSQLVDMEMIVDGAEAVIDCELFVRSLTIRHGGIVTHSAGQTNGLRLHVAGTLFVDGQSFISAEGKGYAAGPGGTSSSDGSGGAGYGGNGGTGQLTPGGSAYGSITEPRELGSGGSAPGGGAIHLRVDGVLRLDGRVMASSQAGNISSGAGAGGSIYIEAVSLIGQGAIEANGGNGGSAVHLGGGGGGGRIALVTGDNSFTGPITACGGAGYVPGGAGTIYRRLSSQTLGVVLTDNCGRQGGTTEMIGTQNLGTLRVRNGAVVGPREGERLVLNIAGDLFVDAGGLIAADGKGHPSTAGPGGRPVGNGQGGAGHGGAGGAGQSSAGGSTYGSIPLPEALGSGAGGRGGGALCVEVTGLCQIDGQISANGISDGSSSGGGAGGSLIVRAATLTGNGAILANGGAGGASSQLGGGGGGGRIAIYTSQNNFSGTVSACGGAGSVPGGAGTIFWQDVLAHKNRLVVDNCSRVGAATILSGTNSFDAVLIQRGGIVSPLPGAADFHLIVSGDVAIEAGGFMAANGLGHPAGVGPGAAGAVNGGGGAGYGGVGGAGQASAGGAAYGSQFIPSELGSGASGAGGGHLQLTVGGVLTVNGGLQANGLSGAPQGGGGSGGSIRLIAGSLLGGGAISANGGNGAGSPLLGGGGGGGRIAIQANVLSFTSIQANPGAGFSAGQPGTVELVVP